MAPTSSMIRPIQGYRALLSIWIVCCHVATHSSFLLYKGPDPDKYKAWLQSGWSTLAVGLGFQVDVFFVISGFLLSLSMLQSRVTFRDLPRALVSFTVKRLLRLWPVMIFVVVMTYIIGDQNSSDLSILSQYFLLPVGRHDLPLGFGVVWSNRVDLESCLVLIVILYIVISCNELSYWSVWSIAALSIYPKLSRYLHSPDSFGYLSIPLSERRIPSFMHVAGQLYMQQRYHLAENDIIEPPGPRSVYIFYNEYLVTHQRWTPFFVGLALAYAYYRTLQANKHVVSTLKQWLHRLLLLLALFLLHLPVFIALVVYIRSRSATPNTTLSPPFIVNLMYSVFGRSLFALSAGYLMFRCIVPSSHPLYLSSLSSLLSHPTLQFLGNMSYGVYMIHMKICYEVLWGLLPPLVMNQYFGPHNLFLKFIVHVTVVYTISLILAYIAYNVLEQPVMRWTPRLLSALKLEMLAKNENKRNYRLL